MEYLRNAWYVAASANEVGRAPLGRTLLDEPVLLYRKEDGKPVALFDECPHRFVPLSLGKLRGDEIECLYHGLRFDISGTCTLNPHGNGVIPRQACVKNYPLAERYGYVWIWPGDPAQADARLLPALPFLEDPAQFAVVSGYLHTAANYQLVVDNLMDLTHVEFLHPFLARAQGLESTRTELFQEGTHVIANRWKPNSPLNGLTRMFWTSGTERGDSRANMHWMPPSNLSFDLGTAEVDGPVEDGLCLPAAHLLTPETETTCHYFWSQARNWRRDDAALGERLRSMTDNVFRTEDKPVTEAQQRRLGASGDLMARKPVLLESDGPAIRARRILAQLIEAEHQKPVASSAA